MEYDWNETFIVFVVGFWVIQTFTDRYSVIKDDGQD